MSELKVENLRIEWPGFSKQWSFSLQGNERVAVAGASGAGKSTLLRALAGLPVGLNGQVSGSVQLNGRQLLGLKPEQRNIGMVFQDPLLFPSMSLLENVVLGLRYRSRLAPLDREAQGMAALQRLGLGKRAHESVIGLSGGEKQRISFLRAVLPGPELLLLDEPFTALDPEMKERLRSDLLAWHGEAKVPVLLVTHDDREVAALATSTIKAP